MYRKLLIKIKINTYLYIIELCNFFIIVCETSILKSKWKRSLNTIFYNFI